QAACQQDTAVLTHPDDFSFVRFFVQTFGHFSSAGAARQSGLSPIVSAAAKKPLPLDRGRS
ncbi:hypothetical protein PWG14_14180, partial (plasmid) [Chromobacterium amazonense]|uniref:hypothetical protein n=1 Tax=Chromobacterium amazonense TaxID=1382803 RepID=UPI00237E9FBA